MGLLHAIALEALSFYFPSLDLERLRLNLLRGTLQLHHLDLTPGHVLLLASLPFRLSAGTVRDLSLRVPWTSLHSAPVKLQAHGIELHLTEVQFPHRQSHVFDAFENERKREKNRVLAEAERVETPITTLLQKLVPLLLHHVEASINDLVVHLHFADPARGHACLRIRSFSVTSKPVGGGSSVTRRNPPADLAKLVVADGIELVLTEGRETILEMLHGGFRVELAISDGVYQLDIMQREALGLRVDVRLGEIMCAMRGRAKVWRDAFLYGRPAVDVASDVRAWLRYAVAVVTARAGRRTAALSTERFREVMAACVEYRMLHTKRLRREGLGRSGKKRIVELEGLLNAEMILFLRVRARADAMAEEVSEFATKDWLRWALFGHKMSEEREQLAVEIRKALVAVEQSNSHEDEGRDDTLERSEVMGIVARGWSKAKLSTSVDCVSVRVESHQVELGTLSLQKFVVRAEVDASLHSYGFSMQLGEFVVTDGGRNVLGQDRRLGGNDELMKGFLEGKLWKPAFNDVINLTMKVAPTAVVLDVQRMANFGEVVSFIRSFLPFTVSAGPVALSEPQSRSPLSHHSRLELAVTVDVPGIRLSIWKQGSLPNGLKGFFGSVFCLSHVHFFVRDAFSDPQITGSFSAALTAGFAHKSELDSLLVIDEKGNVQGLGQHKHALQIAARMNFDTRGGQKSANMEFLNAFVTISALVSLMDALFPHAATPTTDLGNQSSRMSVPTNGKRSAFKNEEHSRDALEINIAALNFSVRRDELESNGSAALSVKQLRAVIVGRSLSSIETQEVVLTEFTYGGKLCISPATNTGYGLRMEVNRIASRSPIGADFIGAQISLGASPEAVSEIISIFLKLARCVNYIQRGHTLASPTVIKTGNNESPTNQTLISPVSVLFYTVKLNAVDQECRVLARSQNAHFIFGATEFSGSLNALEMIDESHFSGRHKVIIEPMPESEQLLSDQRSLSFNVSPNSTAVHLNSLAITVFRPFVDRLSEMIKKFTSLFQRTAVIDTRSDRSLVADEKAPSSSITILCIQGRDVSVHFPRSPHEPDAISLDALHVTMTIRPVSTVFSIRKLTIMTKTARSISTCVDSTTSPRFPVDPEWAVLVRGLDLDVSHYSKDSDVRFEQIRRLRNEWNIQLLSKAALFISPSQVHLLRTLPDIFSSSVSSPDERQIESKPMHNVNPQVSKPSVYKHATLRVETQSVSVELINEDQNGAVVSSIACLEVNPIRYCRKTLHEWGESEDETRITRWTAETYRVQLEDKSSGMPRQLREIVKYGDDSRLYFPHIAGKALRKKPSIYIESVVRADRKGLQKSSNDIKLHNLHVVLSPHFLKRLIHFFDQCFPSIEDESRATISTGSSFRTGSSAQLSEGPESILSLDRSTVMSNRSDAASPEPLKKISVSLHDSFLQMFGKGRRVGESSIIIHATLMKAVFLVGESGEFLLGSQVRLRDIAVSMIWLPSTVMKANRVQDVLVRSTGPRRENLHSDLNSLRASSEASSESRYGSTWRHPSAVSRERLRWGFFRQDGSHNCESIAFIRSSIFRFPVRESDHMVLVVPTLTIDTHIRSLVRFAYVLSVVEIQAMFEGGKNGSRPHPVKFQVAINRISARMKVPCDRDTSTGSGVIKGNINVRVRAAFNGLIGANPTAVSGSIKLAADVMDDNRGIRDQIVAPCYLNFEAHRAESLLIAVEGEHLVRVVLSPVTIRGVTSILLNALPISRNADQRPHRDVFATDVDVLDTSAIQNLKLTFSLKGVVLCCVAEEPRTQLLRLILREIEATVSFPLSPQEEGELEFSLQDIFLEDTVSWRLYGYELHEESSTRWSSIVTGTENPHRDALVTRIPYGELLLNSMKTLLIRNSGFVGSSSANEEEWIKKRSEVLSKSQRSPLCRCTASWRAPLDHVSANIKLRGFDLNLNMSIISSLLEWINSIKVAAVQVHSSHKRKFASSSKSEKSSNDGPGLQMGIDHLVIEPFEITVSAKAPPRRIQETAILRSLMWLFGSEEVIGLTVQMPSIVFTGDFDSPDRLLQRLRSIYLASFTSARSTRQFLWQAPRIFKLARVAITSFLRKREAIYSVLSARPSESHHGNLGLLQSHGLRDAITAPPSGVTTQIRTTHDTGTFAVRAALHPGDDSKAERVESEDAEKGIETLDITDAKVTSEGSSTDSSGKDLFRHLRGNDSRVPKDERYEFCALFCTDEALIVTSHYLLFAHPSTGILSEPIIARCLIMEYHLTGRRITVVWARIAANPVAKHVARHTRRDTSSMASDITRNASVSEIFMHELECYSSEYASWLHSQLPAPVANLHNRTSY